MLKRAVLQSTMTCTRNIARAINKSFCQLFIHRFISLRVKNSAKLVRELKKQVFTLSGSYRWLLTQTLSKQETNFCGSYNPIQPKNFGKVNGDNKSVGGPNSPDKEVLLLFDHLFVSRKSYFCRQVQ